MPWVGGSRRPFLRTVQTKSPGTLRGAFERKASGGRGAGGLPSVRPVNAPADLSFQSVLIPFSAVEFGEEVRCKTNPIGVKGIGESGTIGAPPVVINAIIDALGPLGIDRIDMPATPSR